MEKPTTLTFVDLDTAIDRFEEVTRSYIELIADVATASLLPVEQFDWYRQFSSVEAGNG
jgi:hypothetical protein